MSPRRGATFVCGATFVATLLSAMSPLIAQSGPATVVVAPVISRVVSPSQAFVANVKSHRQVTVGSAVDGRVLEYFAVAGQAIDAGQPLAQLRTGTIELEIAAAAAELDLRKAELDELKNGSRPEEIELAEATVRAAQAATDFATSRLERAEKLFRGSAGLSQDEFEESRSLALQAAETLAESQARAELVRQGPRKEQITQAIARVATQEGLIEVLKDRMEKYTVRSPFRGFVSAELTQAGAWVKQGDAVAEVVEIDPIEVEVLVPEANIGFVQVGTTCPIRVDAIPERLFEGRIFQIVPLADNRSRTFPVRVIVDNPADKSRHALLPGMLARAELPTAASQERLLVPKDALQVGGQTSVVFKVVDKRAVVVPVVSGPATGEWVSISVTSGESLSIDDRVIVRGNARLRPGQDVRVESEQPMPTF